MSAPRKLLLLGWDSADWKLFKPLLEAGYTSTNNNCICYTSSYV